MSPSIVISNVSENERLPHPLVVLDGHVTDFHELGLQQSEWFIDARLDATRGAFWPVTATGHFKALVLLPEPGSFTVTLRIGEYCVREFYITYEPPVSRHVVRFYYQKSCDAYEGEGFDAPPGVDNSDQAAIMKIRFNAMMLQTAAAEMLVRAGLKRKTFALEFGADGLPHVHLLRTGFSNEEARCVSDHQLLKMVEEDIVGKGLYSHDEFEYKHVVILGSSKWNPSRQQAEGHAALSGGRVSIFGSCGLHTWPRHLGEVSSHFLNNTRIDTNYVMDDSAYRGTHWANYSTGIGALIHELGNMFGLSHASAGIMGRGFDDMNRLFCVVEADHKLYEPAFYQDFYDGRLMLNYRVIREVTGPGGAHWDMDSAMQLMQSHWISGRSYESECGPRIDTLGPVGGGVDDDDQKKFQKKPLDGEIGAVCIKAKEYLEKIKSYTREEVQELEEKKMRSKKHKHWVVFAPGEYITHVEVRAGAWIDGLRIHTNLRATRWFGGFGGMVHELRANHGHKINGFFGRRGDDYVGCLGVYCERTSESSTHHHGRHSFMAVPEYMETVPPLGGGLSEGPHSGFDFRSTPIGAIVIKCDEFVESIRVVSPGEHAVATRDTESGYYDSDELVFDLLEGEYIERVSIRSGHWIDAVQLHTNLRSSPWFGGKGGGRSEIECPPGHRVCGLHGRRGYYYVDLLGLYTCANDRCHSAPSAAESNTVQVGPVGLGEQDGTQHAFSTVNGTADLELGAIFVEAQDFVSRVWTYSKRDVAAMGQGGFHSHGQRQWFVLGTDEYVTRVEVRAMCWLGGLRVHTDKRSSPWYGGNGGQLQSLEPPAGFKIHGFFGSTGNSFVGKLGAYCSPIPGHSEVYEQRAISGSAATISGPTHFSLLDASDRMGHLAHSGVARGVLVAVHNGVVMKVLTFDCVETKTHEVQQLQCFVCAGAQVHCFSLRPGEMLVQVDISVTQPPPSHTHEFAHHQHQSFSIEGICFHTTSRCSSWFGSYTDSQLRFFAAPTGAVIKSIIGVPGTLSVQDIVGEFMPHATAILHSSREIDGYNHLEGAIEDPGTYDIRVKSQSSHGIESVLLLKNRNEELLDEHAWMWRKSSTAPLTWCLPQRMLEHHIAYTAEEQGVTPREYLFSKCALGAMDVGGAYSKSGPPPSAY